jgi:hypothetical protein
VTLSIEEISERISSKNGKVVQALLIVTVVLVWVLILYAERYEYNASGFVCQGGNYLPPEAVGGEFQSQPPV